MMDDPNDANPQDHRLREVLAAYYEAAEHGSAPDRQILLDRHPELAADLIEFFAIQDQMHDLAEPLRIKFPQPSNDPEASGPNERDSALERPRGERTDRAGFRGGAFSASDRFPNHRGERRRLRHPHIVPIYEVGDNHGCNFFSMKLIEGGDLAERLGEFTQDPRATARLMALVARAVQHAHDRGILHRDLKPSNILIDDRRNPLVADFGLARRLEGNNELTRMGAASLSPGRGATTPNRTRSGKSVEQSRRPSRE